MLSGIIILLVLLVLTIHRHLTGLWERGILAYPAGFLLFANFFLLTYTVSFIWMLGFVWGFLLALLAIFQVIFTTFLWIFLVPSVIREIKNPYAYLNPKPTVYAHFAFLVPLIFLLSVINFFVSEYGELRTDIVNYFGGKFLMPLIVLASIVVLSNLVRLLVMSRLSKIRR